MHRPLDSTKLRFVWASLLVAAGILGILYLFAVCHRPSPDAAYYLAMSKRPFTFTIAPFGYRILSPLLVHLMPVSIDCGWKILAALSILAAQGTLLLFLNDLGFSARYWMLGVAFLGFSYIGIRVVTQPISPDPLNTFLLMLLFIGTIRQQPTLSGAALALGALNRASMLLFAPIYYFGRQKIGTRIEPLLKCALLALPAVAVVMAVRFLLFHHSQPFAHTDVLDVVQYQARRGNLLLAITGHFAFTYSFLWLLAPAGLRQAPPVLRKLSYAIVVIVMIHCFFAADWGRMIALAFPVVIPLSLYALRGICRTRSRYVATVLQVTCVTLYILTMWVTNVDTAGPLLSYLQKA